MTLQTLALLLLLGGLAIFTLLNWAAFTTPTTLSLGFTNVQAPLGLIMLVMTAVIVMLFLLFVVYLQSSVLLEGRRYARELKAQRDLADKAEASRLAELRSFAESRLQQIEASIGKGQASTQAGLDQLEDDLRSTIERAGNTLAAYIGEVEDRLERKMGSGESRPAP